MVNVEGVAHQNEVQFARISVSANTHELTRLAVSRGTEEEK